MNDGSNLSKLFASGQFAVSAELGPPRGQTSGSSKKSGISKGQRRCGQCDGQPDSRRAHVQYCGSRVACPDGAGTDPSR